MPITVRASGICGSELHGFRSVGFRRPPLVMGHEFAGETPDGAARRGEPVAQLRPSATCAVAATPSCAADGELLGVHLAGGFAERVAVPAVGRCTTSPTR